MVTVPSEPRVGSVLLLGVTVVDGRRLAEKLGRACVLA